ncbi:uncharacterized protein Z518_05074 [Rhinocladiella mackenziei CBS 650.93]|uniref:Zn(2)-C6 fungal-type domain-containing protein n=1 Tax=Rhinocladiella mackenziei CBS 650.93 TaxID=1442369 RepID=A0A0D2FXT1_9EURO|nr:uncharacterized protein Z518_05074 [Rhinocladiella mackenziei CBS 650.93]KIX07097.1 hypothetical protein Z518_05074 [Rhinocladiella mackenziei CBS 650.93]
MPEVVEGEKREVRRKKFAPKTRSGCVNCKKRRIKCDEAKPSCCRCITYGIVCYYDPPKTWLFDPKNDQQTRQSLINTTTTTTSTNRPVHSSASAPSGSSIARLDENLYQSQHEHDAFKSWVFFLTNYVEPRSSFVGQSPDVWSIVIPQIAYHSVALRHAMIACGTMIQAMQRKELGDAFDRSTTTIVVHATRAFRELSMHERPLLEVVLTAHTFWSLDLMSGKFKSAMMHILSAMKIAQQSRKALASDALANFFVQGMVAGFPPDPETLKDTKLEPSDDADPPAVKKAKAVPKLEHGYDQVLACRHRVMVNGAPEKPRILFTLDALRSEIQWILSQYNTPESYDKWLQSVQGYEQSERDPDPLPGTTPGICYRILTDVDNHIGDKPGFDIVEWEKECMRTMMMFMVLTAGSDLTLRHTTMEFFEYSRQIRQPRRQLRR